MYHRRALVSIVCLASVLTLLVLLYNRHRRIYRVRCLRGSVRLVTTESERNRKRNLVLGEILGKCSTDEGLFELANLYKRGLYGLWSPNPYAADDLCRHLVLFGRCPDIKTDSMNLLYEENPRATDCSGPVVPLSHENIIRKSLVSRIKRTTPPSAIKPMIEPRRPTPIRSDAQNSHQHSVVVSSRNTLKALPHTSDTDILDVIESYIGSDYVDPLILDETKAKALHALDTITTFESEQFDGISEKQALARIWTTPKNRDLLIHQLASSIEDGMPVCHTGKMTRFASVLDDGMGVIPMYAVKDDLLQKALSIREKYLSSSSESEKQDYLENDDSTLKEKMVRDFMEEASSYSKYGGYDSNVMRPVIDEIAEHGF